MSDNAGLTRGRILLSIVALVTIVSLYVADWNALHICNPLWPPHAKVQHAQTMAMAVPLAGTTLFFLWGGIGLSVIQGS